MRRREFITLLGGAAATALPRQAGAQKSERIRRIGAIIGGAGERDPQASPSKSPCGAARLGRFLGWVEGRNLRLDVRWPAGDLARVQTAAKDLVALKPDVLFAANTPSVAALLRETRTIPIVFANLSDPVGSGLVANLARPGGNATGLCRL